MHLTKIGDNATPHHQETIEAIESGAFTLDEWRKTEIVLGSGRSVVPGVFVYSNNAVRENSTAVNARLGWDFITDFITRDGLPATRMEWTYEV